MESLIDKEYQVCFVGDFFDMTVNLQGVDTDDETAIIDLANNVLISEYGWNALEMATIDIEVRNV